MTKPEWFENWFDSPYYHILYKYRDEQEAEAFINKLIAYLDIPAGAEVLDLACGRGRYALHLANQGLQVTGVDLSENSIAYAKALEHEHLSFYRHDMRKPFREASFDYVFNFFTSFGYFKTRAEDLQALRSTCSNLRPGGTFVLDFFNANYVQQRLTGREKKVVDGIHFDIHKYTADGRVIKQICFAHQGQTYCFEEQVKLLGKADFELLLTEAGFQLETVFGDYQLAPFHPADSPRLILVATKN